MGFALLGALTFSLFAADDAAAQQLPPNSVSYTTTPEGIVTVQDDGNIVVIPQTNAGTFTVTVQGFGYTLSGGSYIRSNYNAQKILTLSFISSCSVGGGCAPFGISGNETQRIAALRAMDATTLRRFFASGADPNERLHSQANSYLLFYMLQTIPHTSPQISVIIEAGADVNAVALNGNSMLHLAAGVSDQPTRFSNLINIEGISINITNDHGQTPLDVLALAFGSSPLEFLRDLLQSNADDLREKGGVCRIEANRTNAPGYCIGE